MGTQIKSAPAGAETPVTPGLTAEKERLMTQRISEEPDHKQTCRVFLELAQNDLDTAKRARGHYITLARKYGLSNVDIAAVLGISEAAVRGLISRGGGA